MKKTTATIIEIDASATDLPDMNLQPGEEVRFNNVGTNDIKLKLPNFIASNQNGSGSPGTLNLDAGDGPSRSVYVKPIDYFSYIIKVSSNSEGSKSENTPRSGRININ